MPVVNDFSQNNNQFSDEIKSTEDTTPLFNTSSVTVASNIDLTSSAIPPYTKVPSSKLQSFEKINSQNYKEYVEKMKRLLVDLENDGNIVQIKTFEFDVDIELTELHSKLVLLEKEQKIYYNLKKLAETKLERIEQKRGESEDIDSLFEN